MIRSVCECFGVSATLLQREAQANSLAGGLTLSAPRAHARAASAPRAAVPPGEADMELDHLQSALVRAAHVHAGHQEGRELSVHSIGEMLSAALDRIETRQDAVCQAEEHLRRAS
ncbi:MAG: hypothetical protein KY467_08290 [Gemmatimonadetes bacterium]|nr:hypothetical protein [Gemmatimonadota bacterium]